MIVIGENLKQLMIQHKITEPYQFDNTSISLTLSKQCAKYKDGTEVIYGTPLKENSIEWSDISATGLELPPGACYICCSNEKVFIPEGYMGFIQTKGSLARLFISVQCSDGQIETGFKGKITFEIVNIGNVKVIIHPTAKVAQLFICKTSTKLSEPYTGKYNNSEMPTVYNFARVI